MQIRKCRDDEISSTGAFYDNVVEYLDAHINYPKWVYREYPSEEYARAMTARGCQYVCENDGRTVAAFVLNRDPEGSYQMGRWSRQLEDGEYMVIHALAVDPSLQGTGIGRDIISFCIDTAKADGAKAIRLDIVPGNIPAKKLYESFGFSYVGDEDVRPDIEHIPAFSLYELNF